jgi:uncharacterized protein (DUF58 family)
MFSHPKTVRASLHLPPGSPAHPLPPKRYWLPRTIRPTREGWWFIGTTFAVGLAATNTGNNLLYLILAMMLSFMAVSGVLSEQTLRHLRLQREIPRRIFAGLPASFGVRLLNRKRRLPSYALHVSEADPAAGPPAARFFLKIPPQTRDAWLYPLTFPSRGRQYLPGLRLSTRFPFGLFAKTSRPLLADPVLVYPAIRTLAPDEVPSALAPGWRERNRRGQGAGLYNLRPYRPGDDPRLLHWKTSARAGELMVKELEDEDRPRVRLVVEDPPGAASSAAVEADLCYVASVAAHAIRLGAAVHLATAEGAIDFGQGQAHLDRILERLALYERPPAPRPIPGSAEVGQEIRVRLGSRATAPAEGPGP